MPAYIEEEKKFKVSISSLKNSKQKHNNSKNLIINWV